MANGLAGNPISVKRCKVNEIILFYLKIGRFSYDGNFWRSPDSLFKIANRVLK